MKPYDRIQELTRILIEANHKYYNLDAPDMPDFEYDKLLRELEELEAAYPEYAHPGSPTKFVGGRASDKFEKVTHKVPLMSLRDVFSFDELTEFIEKVKVDFPGALFTVEPKIDGLSVALEYKNGVFLRGVTRGDGMEGEDVTHNILTISSVPKVLNGYSKDIIVRGEVYMPKEVFWELNRQNEEDGKPLFANPRNAAAGSLRQLDPSIAAKRKLDVFVFNLQYCDDNTYATHSETLEFMKAAGFPIVSYNRLSSMDDILQAVNSIDANREKYPCDIDGAVIKVDHIDMRNQLGETAKYPKWAVAYKYPPEIKSTVVEDIVVQVGRTGVLTPKAVVKPVYLAGTTVTFATLHNQDFITERDIRIGDTVRIRKAGEIIPEILDVDFSKRPADSQPYLRPERCPVCGAETRKDEDGSFLRCTSIECPAQLIRNLTHFVSKDAMDITGMGQSIIEALVEKKMIKSPADIYHLTFDQLKTLWKNGTTSAENLLAAIEATKTRELHRLIYAFGIRNVGLKTSKLLSKKFGVLENLMNAPLCELTNIPDVGEITGRAIYDWFRREEFFELYDRMKSAGLNCRCKMRDLDSRYAGLTFVFTGALTKFTREEAIERIERLGGKAAAAVSKNTNFIIVGDKAGSKLKKAEEFGVPVLTEEEFERFLGIKEL